jgi:phosphatidylserine/phosphatidylglycerophosphate/cardiolipin synthase-like enzyme
VKTPRPELLAAVARLARDVPAPILNYLCERLVALPDSASAGQRRALAGTIIQAPARQSVERLVRIWADCASGVSPAHLAWLVQGAVATNDLQRSTESIELVWTGPGPASTTFRRTDQALYQLIEGARRALILVTFAAYYVPDLAAALARAASPDLSVTFILEDPQSGVGQAAFTAMQEVSADLASRSEFYIWPLEKRPTDAAGHHGSLHVKCAVADRDAVLLSSANLTGHALHLNMEMGLFIRGGNIPRQVSAHLRRLIEDGVLVRVPR